MMNARVVRLAVVASSLAVARTLGAQTPDSSLHTAAATLIRHFAAKWSNADAAGLSELFTEDADLVIPSGVVATGRTAIRAFYQSAFANGYAGSTSGASIARTRQLSSRIAVVDAVWFITGARTPSGSPAPSERGILTAVLRLDDDGWHITALREQSSATGFSAAKAPPEP